MMRHVANQETIITYVNGLNSRAGIKSSLILENMPLQPHPLLVDIGDIYQMELFFIITPYRYDQLFRIKKSIVMNIAAQYHLFPSYAAFDVPLLTAGFQLDNTMASIRRCNFIIADLTYERPSCYYEIGYAHGL